MKKWLFGFILIILLIAACIYLFIPPKLMISREVTVVANQQGVFRFLSNKENWRKWWPDKSSEGLNHANHLIYGDYQFGIQQVLHNAFEITVSRGEAKTSSLLQIFSYSVDSINIKWSTEFVTGNNPVARIQQYLAARQLGIFLEKILHDLGNHVSNLKNIYGVDVKKEKVKIQLLITTKEPFSSYPRIEEIYAMINKLQDHRKKFNVTGDSLPMLSVQKLNSSEYVAQVALPVDKNIPGQNDIAVKWMMKDGNILTGEVMGGIGRIDSSMSQMEQYISDYRRTIIAIPFQLLLTDRLQQTDTTKWVTRLYYPVI